MERSDVLSIAVNFVGSRRELLRCLNSLVENCFNKNNIEIVVFCQTKGDAALAKQIVWAVSQNAGRFVEFKVIPKKVDREAFIKSNCLSKFIMRIDSNQVVDTKNYDTSLRTTPDANDN